MAQHYDLCFELFLDEAGREVGVLGDVVLKLLDVFGLVLVNDVFQFLLADTGSVAFDPDSVLFVLDLPEEGEQPVDEESVRFQIAV